MPWEEDFKIAYRESAFRDSTALSDDTGDTIMLYGIGLTAGASYFQKKILFGLQQGLEFGARRWNGRYEIAYLVIANYVAP